MTHNEFTLDYIIKAYDLIDRTMPPEYEEDIDIYRFLHTICKRSDPFLRRRLVALGNDKYVRIFDELEELLK